jgi:serine/threonine-protein kinase
MDLRGRQTDVSPTERTIPNDPDRTLAAPRFDEKSVQRALPAVPLTWRGRARASSLPVILLCVAAGLVGGLVVAFALTLWQNNRNQQAETTPAPQQTAEAPLSPSPAPESTAATAPTPQQASADAGTPQGGAQTPAPDWQLLLREAGLESANFQPVASSWVPWHQADARAAWDGADPLDPGQKIHVEAAALHGRVVYFDIIYPWVDTEPPPQSAGTSVLTFILLAVIATALIGSALIARRNLRLGRGDRRGATRVAAFYFAVGLLALLAEHHNGLPRREYNLFFFDIASDLFNAAFIWLLYVALEPFVRRRWPERIISWSRLLAGGWRDPLVGRDVLVGAVCGVAYELCIYLAYLAPKWQGRAAGVPLYPDARMYGTSLFINYLGHQVVMPVFFSLILLMVMFLLFVVTRRTWLAAALTFLLVLPVEILTFGVAAPLAAPFIVAAALIEVGVLYRFGLLALVSLAFLEHLWVFFPVTTELSAWYAGGFVIDALVCLALAVYGFYTSLAGQPLLRGGLLGD